MTRRVVITGVGIVAPTGIGAETYWKATLAGECGIDRITRFDVSSYPVQLAGEVKDFDPAVYIPGRIMVQTDRWTHFALAAAELAVEDARLDLADVDPFDIGVTTASSSGGNEFGQRETAACWGKGPRYVGPYQSIAWFYAASTGQISIASQLKGPCGVVATESAAGLDALAQARRMIRRGTKVMICGGTEAPVGPYAFVCQLESGWLSRTPDPARAYRPFAADADGYVPGEGGAMLVLEEAEAARERGATALAEIIGYGAAFGGPRSGAAAMPSAPGVDKGRGGFDHMATALAVAIRKALADARLNPSDVDVVFADGVGIPEADHAEAQALHTALGAYASIVPVTAPKAAIGRLYSGGAALDVATAAIALREGMIPPTPGVSEPDSRLGIDLVTGRPRTRPLRTALVVARGFGGFASALVLRKTSAVTEESRRAGYGEEMHRADPPAAGPGRTDPR